MMGPPYSGKGTYSKMLSKKFGVTHISTGELFRLEISLQTKLGMESRSYVENGKLVPNNLVQKLLEQKLRDIDIYKGLVFDGFPRSIDQIPILDFLLDRYSIKLNFIFNLYVTQDTILSRAQRRIKKSQRLDDTDSLIFKRIDAYYLHSSELIRYFKNKNFFFEIDSNLNRIEAFNQILKAVNNFI